MTPRRIKSMTSQLIAQCHHKHTLNNLHLPALIVVRTSVTDTSSAQHLNCTTANTEHIMSHWKYIHKLICSCLLSKTVQLQPPCILYIQDGCPASPPPAMAFYIFSQELHLLNFLRHAENSLFISTKCCVFHYVMYLGI